MIGLILLQIVITKKIEIDAQKILLNGECYQAKKQFIRQFEYKYNIKFAIADNIKHCKNNIQTLFGIDINYKYGKWCGKNYGGFNNQCSKYCLQNLDIPSDECIDCNYPIDWVDEQCMYHDFCMTRFEKFNIGYGDACDDKINLGNPFPSPCECAQNLTEHLKLNYLAAHCQLEPNCLLHGEIIGTFFQSEIIKCSCSYKQCNNNTIDSDGNFIESGEKLDCWNATACVKPDQCTALNGN